MVVFMACLIALLVLGIGMLIKPYYFWRYSQCWISEGGEPTDLALIAFRISGAVLLLVSACAIGVLLFY